MVNPRIPPHDEQAEQSILGSILIDPEAIVEVADRVKPEFFYYDRNSKIFETMLNLYANDEPIDLVTLTSKLKKAKLFKRIGGASYLSDLLNIVPTSGNIKHYASIVEDAYIKRKLISVAAKATEEAFKEEKETAELLDTAESAIFSLTRQHIKQDFISLKEAMTESYERISDIHKSGGKLRGVSTGFVDLDNRLAGMQASNLLILAARPGIGKTAFALNIAKHAALKDKVPVAFFSLEMSKEELVDRLLVSQANIDAWKLKTGRLSDTDFANITQAMTELSKAELFIDDTPGLNVLELRTKARKLQAEKNIGLVIVDYLQLAEAGRRFDNRVVEVTMVSQSLKNLARELKVPVVALSQLSRAIETRGAKQPQLADLRESGAIEQDADVVMFLYREEDNIDEYDKNILTKLYIAKHRNGKLGLIDLVFHGNKISFFGMEKGRR
jgi:replicative DNA helicase